MTAAGETPTAQAPAPAARPTAHAMAHALTHLRVDDTIGDLLDHPAFAGFGRLLLPWDDRRVDPGMRLRDIGALLPYHSHVDPAVVVASLNRMVDDAAGGRTVFYKFYTAAEQAADPTRRNTGLFFFRGTPHAPFALIPPRGGFAYLGAVHEGFPYAAEVSRRGFNAFVLRYRAGQGGRVATEDLAATLTYVVRHGDAPRVRACAPGSLPSDVVRWPRGRQGACAVVAADHAVVGAPAFRRPGVPLAAAWDMSQAALTEAALAVVPRAATTRQTDGPPEHRARSP